MVRAWVHRSSSSVPSTPAGGGVVAAAALATVLGCGLEPEPRYVATISRTSHGVAHVLAEDYGSLGFGQGWAFAEDRACILLDQIVKLRSERARYFGPGEAGEHLDTDFGYLHLKIRERAAAALPGRGEAERAMLRGYVAGFNAYVAEVGADGLVGHCQGQPWVGPIDEVDLFSYYLDLGYNASSKQLVDVIGRSQPPGAGLAPRPTDALGRLAAARDAIGSNGWAIGKDRSSNGQGLMLINPHFPWEGELRLWESHLTIPGELDVYGASLSGVTAELLGFNEHLAWMHPVSAGTRFTFYVLELGAEPTTYRYDGETRPMTAETYEIQVLVDGELRRQSRTLYRTHHGPLLALEPFGWTNEKALTFRDANLDNEVLIAQWLGTNAARTMDEYQQVHREVQGIPWVNTVAVSSDGRAWYMDSTPTPNLSKATLDAHAERRASDIITAGLWGEGFYALDGSTSRDEWVEEPGARSPGLIPFDRLPQLERSDYVFNANDSYWLSHHEQKLEGYHPLHGGERTTRSLRTRMNLRVLTELGGASGADGLWDIDELKAAALNNRSFPAELLRAELVARCTGAAPVEVMFEGQPRTVDLGPACALLAGWDGVFDLDRRGAIVFREWLGDYPASALRDAGLLYQVGFDPDDPIETPRGLAPPNPDGSDRALQALARAVLRLGAAQIPLDAPLGEVQYAIKAGQRIPIHGSIERDGVTNKVDYSVFQSALIPNTPRGDVVNPATRLAVGGYVINNGTSFISAIQFTPDGPDAWAFLTYGQSDDPDSPYFDDQTSMFSAKDWRRCLFKAADIRADPVYRIYKVTGN